MKMKIVGITVAVLVSLTVLAGVLMPILDDGRSVITEKTFSNETVTSYGSGDYYTDDVTIVLDPTGTTSMEDAVLTVNGANADYDKAWNGIRPVAVGDNFCVLFNTYSESNTVDALYFLKDTSDVWRNGQTNFSAGVVTITYDSEAGTVNLKVGSSVDYTSNVTYFFGITGDDGKYQIITSTSFPDMYMDQKSIDNSTGGMIAMWNKTVTVNGTSYTIRVVSDKSGTHGIQIQGSTLTDADAELTFVNLDNVSGSTDIFTGGSPVFNISVAGETVTQTPSASYILKDVSGHVENAQSDLLGVIPILIIVAILLGVVALVIRSRMD